MKPIYIRIEIQYYSWNDEAEEYSIDEIIPFEVDNAEQAYDVIGFLEEITKAKRLKK